MLQDNSQFYVRAGLDELFGPGGGDLQRLLEQDVLARRGELFHELEMRVRRREDQDRVNALVVNDLVERIRLRKRKALRELRPASRRRAVRIRNFYLQVLQALRVRRDGHSQAD